MRAYLLSKFKLAPIVPKEDPWKSREYAVQKRQEARSTEKYAKLTVKIEELMKTEEGEWWKREANKPLPTKNMIPLEPWGLPGNER